MVNNKLETKKLLNKLWGQVYPSLASVIMDDFARQTGRVLEVGPFSGGISMELARLHPNLDITITTWESNEIKYLENELAEAGFLDRIEVVKASRSAFDFADEYFDLIICRGALFFLHKGLLLESFRMLAKNGFAFIGGGYGKNTPRRVIDAIHDKSHLLNQSLGKRWITRSALEKLVRETELTDYCRIEEEGGLWLTIRK
ncbi:class I SAM-dependent methyltransferase [Chloroflexota bacterium]